jgi:hypothetical protein
VVIDSPIPTPTPADGNTRPGKYEARDSHGEQNCDRVGVAGNVREEGDKTSIQFVEVEVTGEDKDYKGPYITKTDGNGNYDIFLGHPDQVKGKIFNARIIGGGVDSEEIRWRTSSSCNQVGGIQMMYINWQRR